MNERIKELMVQVCKEQGLPFTVDHNRAYMLDNFSEKFAELIVRECILTIQMGITRDGHNTEKYLRSMEHLKQIKQHFGVEE
jgi:hypothetical protein